MLVGDSFTEGAGTTDADSIAGVLREQRMRVVNVGRGGTGPLFQLAAVREYGEAIRPKVVVWIVFTGNDLANLREEKGTALARYLEAGYTQELYRDRVQVSDSLKIFLNEEVEYSVRRRDAALPLPRSLGYGETLDLLEAKEKELTLFRRVAESMLQETQQLGATLFVITINHTDYNHRIQDLTAQACRSFCSDTTTGYWDLSRDEIAARKDVLFSRKHPSPHFQPAGYRWVGEQIFEALKAHGLAPEKNSSGLSGFDSRTR